jgi:hypothetical protein
MRIPNQLYLIEVEERKKKKRVRAGEKESE